MNVRAFQKKILAWFSKNQRPLPWRADYEPYAVWVSEIMLQQTQVETVLPYFRRWMRELPNIRSLAKCPEKKVLKLWEGLGYYSRARNIHKTAAEIAENHGGVFPSDYETILSLKGIGRYTAGAIASIAFNQDTPILDGNVIRVLSRIYAIGRPLDTQKNKERLWRLEESLIPKGSARFFNQALMELGALVCTHQDPACAQCPVRDFCLAFKRKNPEAYPVRRQRKKITPVSAGALVLARDGKYFIRLRPVGKIMGGLWEFPEWKLAKKRTLPLDTVEEKIRRLAADEFKLTLDNPRYLGTLKRNYTRYSETLNVFLKELDGSEIRIRPKTGWPGVWASKNDFRKYPFSSAHLKIVSLLRQVPQPFAENLKDPPAHQHHADGPEQKIGYLGDRIGSSLPQDA